MVSEMALTNAIIISGKNFPHRISTNNHHFSLGNGGGIGALEFFASLLLCAFALNRHTAMPKRLRHRRHRHHFPLNAAISALRNGRTGE